MAGRPVTGPADFTTLTGMLAARAAESPDRTVFDFDGMPCSYGMLWRRSGEVARHLIHLGIRPGARVIVVIPNSAEFFFAFYGIQRAGGIAVPLFPGFGPALILRYAASCGARGVVAPSATPQSRLDAFAGLARENGLILTTPDAADAQAPETPLPPVLPDDLAFLQFTSGSTGVPKAVAISHDNLLTNMRQMISGMEITRREIFVSWLPVYHDMGLILKTMVPFYLGLRLHLLPSDLQDVERWLSAIQTHRATFTAAPDFAYRLCLRRVRDPKAYDLSTLRVALNAAEPVRMSTIEGFEAAFGLKHVMAPAYGLAEATVGVAMWPPGTAPKADAHGNVSVGKPFPDVKVRIVRDGHEAPAGTVGEIAIASAALPRGYFGNETANRELFWRPGWALTGDLGHVDAAGDLFVVGRRKNIIIQSGRNLHPPEIEAIVDLDPAIRYSVALGIDRGRLEGEQLCVFAEIKEPEAVTGDGLEEIVIRIVSSVHAQMGLRPGRVILLRPKAIPMTYNGKFQHGRLKELYLSGALRENILFPA